MSNKQMKMKYENENERIHMWNKKLNENEINITNSLLRIEKYSI